MDYFFIRINTKQNYFLKKSKNPYDIAENSL